jgi:hypothetical protein
MFLMGPARLLALLLLTGCQSILGLNSAEKPAADASSTDDASDAPLDASPFDAQLGDCTIDHLVLCGPGGYNVETSPRIYGAGTTTITTTTLGEPNCTRVDVAIPGMAGRSACLIYAPSITIDAMAVINVVGTEPLILAADDTVTINGTLSVAAAKNESTCAAAARVAGSNQYGGGGGGGGSYGTRGGDGGTGDGTNVQSGLAANTQPITMGVRGGCLGQPGGTATGGAGGGGNDSGGAVWIIARNAITISGVVLASGQPGHGAGNGAATTGGGGGGGGGGSGGYVRIAAANSIRIGGVIAANGGGGGGGGGCCAGGGGTDGYAGTPSAVGASGGMPGSGSDRGGAGGTGNATSQGTVVPALAGYDAGDIHAGGGGGGGGAGYIVLNQGNGIPDVTGTLSPPPTASP